MQCYVLMPTLLVRLRDSTCAANGPGRLTVDAHDITSPTSLQTLTERASLPVGTVAFVTGCYFFRPPCRTFHSRSRLHPNPSRRRTRSIAVQRPSNRQHRSHTVSIKNPSTTIQCLSRVIPVPIRTERTLSTTAVDEYGRQPQRRMQRVMYLYSMDNICSKIGLARGL